MSTDMWVKECNWDDDAVGMDTSQGNERPIPIINPIHIPQGSRRGGQVPL